MRSVWQQNLNSAGVQNSVIICLFIISLGLITIWFSFALNAHVFRFIFFNCYVSVSIKSLRLSQFSVFPLCVC